MPLERGIRFPIGFFSFFRCQNHIDFGILKTCRAELKIVVHGVDVGMGLKFLELLTIDKYINK